MVGRGVVAQRLGQPVEVAQLEFGRGRGSRIFSSISLARIVRLRSLVTISRSSSWATKTNSSNSSPAGAIRAKRTIGCGTRSTRGWLSADSRRIASSFATSVPNPTVSGISIRLDVSE